MKTIHVGISGINAIDNPGPGIGVARSLKEDKGLKIKTIGLAFDAMETGNFMDWLIDHVFILPYPSGGHEEFLNRLQYIKKKSGLDFVIPNLDAELPLYIKYATAIEKLGIKTFLPSAEQFRLRGKDRLQDVAEKINIQFPKSIIVSSYDDLMRAVEKIGLPVMVKGPFYKAYRAFTTQEAITHYYKIVAEWGYPVIVQQVVSGEEMNVVGVGDGEGNSLGMVGIRKLGVTALGKIWTGVTIKNDAMLDASEHFIGEYKWRGGFELECIVNGETVYLIEINPRLPAWSYFATGVGINLPSNMLRKVYGLPVPPNRDYPLGKLFIRYTYELITDMKPFQDIATKGEKE